MSFTYILKYVLYTVMGIGFAIDTPLDRGFWIAMGISALVAVLMNIVFWSMKPYGQKR